MQKQRIIFFGTSDFGQPTLAALIAQYEVVAVITAEDKPQGRNHKLLPSPITLLAQAHHIPVFQPKTLKNNTELLDQLTELKPDLGIVVAYGKLIPRAYIDLPQHKILNIHPSLLPHYRGPSPIQFALLNGDRKTGISIIQIDEAMDHGPIIAQEKVAILPDMNYRELLHNLAERSAKLLIATVTEYVDGSIDPKPQNEIEATFTRLLVTDDGLIQNTDNVAQAYNKIRALNSEPGTYTMVLFNNRQLRLKIHQARPSDHHSPHPSGSLYNLKGQLAFQLTDGSLILDKIQLEAKKPITGSEFLQGYRALIKN